MRVGTLDKPGALKPDVHIYTRTKAKWLKLPKRTPSFRDYYKTRKLWPKASFKRLNAALGVTRNAGGVEAGPSQTRATVCVRSMRVRLPLTFRSPNE